MQPLDCRVGVDVERAAPQRVSQAAHEGLGLAESLLHCRVMKAVGRRFFVLNIVRRLLCLESRAGTRRRTRRRPSKIRTRGGGPGRLLVQAIGNICNGRPDIGHCQARLARRKVHISQTTGDTLRLVGTSRRSGPVGARDNRRNCSMLRRCRRRRRGEREGGSPSIVVETTGGARSYRRAPPISFNGRERIIWMSTRRAIRWTP